MTITMLFVIELFISMILTTFHIFSDPIYGKWFQSLRCLFFLKMSDNFRFEHRAMLERNTYFLIWQAYIVLRIQQLKKQGFHGVMVSTQDSESCDPSSNLGGTL